MANAWFRFYTEALNDPKVQCLPAELFRQWINVLCLASLNDGIIPVTRNVSFALRISENDAVTVLERLSNAGLIDRHNGGANGWRYAPHGWDKRQYKSDTSTERVKRFRNTHKAVTETPPDTEQSSLESVTSTSINNKLERERGAQARTRSLISDDWKLPVDWGEWAAKETGLDKKALILEARKFHNNAMSKAIKRADWLAEWKIWVYRTKEFKK